MNRKIRASIISIAVDMVLIGIKYLLYVITGCITILADCFHSFSDLFISSVILLNFIFQVWRQRREDKNSDQIPKENSDTANNSASPDNNGFLKIELILSLLIALVILYMPYEIISGVFQAAEYTIRLPWLAILGVSICIVISYFISRFKTIVGQQENSPALEADGLHSRMDMFSSFVVLFSVIGQWIGIKLDPITAVIIAVLIGIRGIDLLIKALSTFWAYRKPESGKKPEKMWQASVLNDLPLNISLFFTRVTSLFSRFWNLCFFWFSFKDYRFWLVVVTIPLFFLIKSLFFIVGPSEQGFRLRLGKIVETGIKPGLHFKIPYPVEKILIFNPQKIFRLELGFRTNGQLLDFKQPRLWETKHWGKGFKKLEEESLYITGDENIIDISAVLQYRIIDPRYYLFQFNNMDKILRSLFEASMREVVATMNLDDLLTSGRITMMKRAKLLMRQYTEKLKLGVEPMLVCLFDIHPPIPVVYAFRDVFSAREDKQRKLNMAQSYQNSTIPRTRGKAVSRVKKAKGTAFEKQQIALGKAKRLKAVAKIALIHPDAVWYRKYLSTIEAVLSGKPKYVVDPSVNTGAYNIWMYKKDKP